MKLTVAKWANSIGISRQAGSKAITRCAIPLDADGMVDVEIATLLYRRRTRPQVRMPRHRTAQVPRVHERNDGVDLLELARDIAAILDDGDDALLAEGAPYLRGVLVRMDDATLAQVRLSVRVWDALTGWGPSQ